MENIDVLEIIPIILTVMSSNLQFFLRVLDFLEAEEEEEFNNQEELVDILQLVNLIIQLQDSTITFLQQILAVLLEDQVDPIQFILLLDPGLPAQARNVWNVAQRRPSLFWWLTGLTVERLQALVDQIEEDVRRPRNGQGFVSFKPSHLFGSSVGIIRLFI